MWLFLIGDSCKETRYTVILRRIYWNWHKEFECNSWTNNFHNATYYLIKEVNYLLSRYLWHIFNILVLRDFYKNGVDKHISRLWHVKFTDTEDHEKSQDPSVIIRFYVSVSRMTIVVSICYSLLVYFLRQPLVLFIMFDHVPHAWNEALPTWIPPVFSEVTPLVGPRLWTSYSSSITPLSPPFSGGKSLLTQISGYRPCHVGLVPCVSWHTNPRPSFLPTTYYHDLFVHFRPVTSRSVRTVHNTNRVPLPLGNFLKSDFVPSSSGNNSKGGTSVKDSVRTTLIWPPPVSPESARSILRKLCLNL